MNGLSVPFRNLTAYQVVTVASLIEKEARFPGDRDKIASVIYNRLAINMPLQIVSPDMVSKEESKNKNHTNNPLESLGKSNLAPGFLYVDFAFSAIKPIEGNQ